MVVPVLLGLACSRDARAAACCISATSFGVGRLLVWEQGALGLQLGHARSLGIWDQTATLRWNPDAYSEGISTAMPWAIVRVHERLELQGWAPVLVNDRWSGETRQAAAGLGDAGAAVRFQAIAIGELHRVPALAIVLGGTAPTGRRVEQTSPPLFAGTTGRGAWAGSLGVDLEYAWLPWFARLEAGVSVFAPFRRSDTGQSQQYGPLLRAALSAGREVVPDRVVVAAALFIDRGAAIELDGARSPDSRMHLASAAASVSWRFDPHWTLLGVLTSSVWPDGLGRNQDARVGFTLGARYGHF